MVEVKMEVKVEVEAKTGSVCGFGRGAVAAVTSTGRGDDWGWWVDEGAD